jgi:streptogramin lyase
MRLPIAAFLALTIPLAAAQRSNGDSRPAKGKAGAPRAEFVSKPGIKIPGVQIPFASLKAEAELPFAPLWTLASDALLAPTAGGLVRIDPRANKPGDPITAVTKPCGGAASGFNSLWVVDCGATGVARLDSKTWKSTAQIAAGSGTAQPAIAVTSDSVWAITDDKTTLSRIDPDQNIVVSQMRFEPGCSSLTFAETALWLLCPAEKRLYRVNPETNVVEKHIELSARPTAIAFGENSIWALCLKEGKVDRIDPKTNKISKTIDLEIPDSTRGGIAVGAGSVWVTLDGFPLTRIDAASEKVVQQFHGSGGGAITFAFNALWLTNLQPGSLWRIDPKRVAATFAE